MIRTSGRLRPALVGLALASGVAHAAAAPLTSNTALPVAEGEFVFREQLVIERSGDDPAGTDRDRTAVSAVSVLGYGLRSDLALFGAVPVHGRRLETTAAGNRRSRDARGLGDLRLVGRYTLLRRDRPGRTLRLAPFAGLEMPTGENDERDAFGTLPAGIQTGSGSWDPFGGVVATYQTLDLQVDLQAAYQANTSADGFTFGDAARLDLSVQVRLWPPAVKGLPHFVYGVIEANLIHQRRNERNGQSDPDSGGTRLFLVPGLQYVTKRWIAEAGVQVPVVQNLNGAALEAGYVVRAGFRVNF